VTRRGAALAPRAIDVVEQVDAEFFADMPKREGLDYLRRLALRGGGGETGATPSG